MDETKEKNKLVGPWRNVHTAVWVIGLAILAWRGWWWPGILVLVAISLVVEAALMRFAPHAFEVVKPVSGTAPVSTPSMPMPPVSRPPEHRFDLLPSVCPKCGGPIRGREVKWTGPQSADCPYCGANLPLKAN